MEKDLIKFYDNLTFINKDLAQYEDEKGNLQIIPNSQLITNVSYEELTKEELKVARFKMVIGKEEEFEVIDGIRQVPKDTITKREEDKFTIVDTKVKVSRVWFVTNGLKLVKAFNNKEEAVKTAKKINEKILKIAEVK